MSLHLAATDTPPHRRFPRIVPAVAVAFAMTAGLAAPAAAQLDPKFDPHAVFLSRCGACHTVGDGVKVGPDLMGVTERRDRAWLYAFVRSSQTLVTGGDPTAAALFEEFQREVMPDHGYSDEEIDQLLEYIAAGGPDAFGPKIRWAHEATAEELALGADLFYGRTRLANGGAACASCHTFLPAGKRAWWKWTGSTVGGDLTQTFSRYGDLELARALAEMRLPVMASVYRDHPLTADERFALKAYLARGAAERAEEGTGVMAGLPWLGLIAGLAAGVAGERRARRRRAAR